MRTTKQILPGVKFIGWVYADRLIPDIALRGIAGMPVPILTDIHDVAFFDEPKCECMTTNDNGNRLDTATLPVNAHIAFIVTDISGGSYIIGSRETPFPVIKRTISFGNTANECAGVKYEITHTAIKSLVKCDI